MKWHTGKPPHVGWWLVRGLVNVQRIPDSEPVPVNQLWSWWDGKAWSRTAYTYYTYEQAATVAAFKLLPSLPVLWSDYWPKNARVPRVAP